MWKNFGFINTPLFSVMYWVNWTFPFIHFRRGHRVTPKE